MEESRAVQKYTAWINAKNVDPLIRRELLNIISSPEDITERFSENLTFGTAGLRAVMGAGTNRINIYTVASAAKGLAACLQASDASEEGVIVCYDSRNYGQGVGVRRDKSIPLRSAAPGSDALFRNPPLPNCRRCNDYRFPQSAGIQRIQGVWK